jgi:hypothetical protein
MIQKISGIHGHIRVNMPMLFISQFERINIRRYVKVVKDGSRIVLVKEQVDGSCSGLTTV